MGEPKHRKLGMAEIYSFVAIFILVTAGLEIFGGTSERFFGQSMLIALVVGLIVGLAVLLFRLLALKRQ
jgi:hypothetical protein